MRLCAYRASRSPIGLSRSAAALGHPYRCPADRSRAGLRATVLACLAAVALAGCQRTVSGENLLGFGRASSAVAGQADLAFSESNKLARQVEIEAFVRSGAPGLSEDSFQGAIARSDIEAWQDSLTALADYGNVLASLVDTKRGVETSDSIVALGQKLSSGSIGLGIDPRISAGFASLGGALIDAAAQREARHVLQRTDPEIQRLLATMAEAIGASDGQGLRGTVRTLSTTALNPIRRSYAAAAERKDEAAQRQLVDKYLAGLEARDARLRSLANLRTSLTELAAAHAAAAKGGPMTAGAMIAQIERRLDETKRLYAAAAKGTGSTDASK